MPEFRDNPFINRLPPQLSQRNAWQFLSDPPEFNPEERTYPIQLRMNCLYRLRRFFEPLEHHLRLESAFSTLLRQGYVSRNPLQSDYIWRLQDGHERILARDLSAGRHYVGGTAEGFALIGASGAGKSTAINRILSYYPQVVTHDEPFSLQQVVWLKLDCPHQGSPKQLCMHFFQELDLALGARTFAQFGKTRNPVDLMMAQMAQLANRHALGVLIIDEIQHLTLAKGVGRDALLNFLVTLINTIGIPVIMIGTMGALSLFQDDFRQARRASGIGCAVWERLRPESAWDHFVDVLWKYQWTRQETPLTDEIRYVLYEESQGVIDVLIKLFMLAQLQVMEQSAFRNTPEVMDARLFRETSARHLKIIEPMMRALKTNNQREISKYDDLRPLDSHVSQVFQNVMPQMETISLSMPDFDSGKGGESGDVDPLIGVLVQAGLATDLATPMAAKVRALHPDASMLELIGFVSVLLQDPGNAVPRKGKRPSGKQVPRKPLAVSRISDMVREGQEVGRNAEESLIAAGLIRRPQFGPG
ncbi:ATP-binding protein [Acidithiobacillus sp. YTS05]|nr:ATP-binding protein [Acidithiobacillus sp. YTS05]